MPCKEGLMVRGKTLCVTVAIAAGLSSLWGYPKTALRPQKA